MVISLEKSIIKIRTYNWYWYVVNGKKGIREGICDAIHRDAKANKKKTRDFDKNKESSCLKYWAVNNMFGSAVS